MTKIEAIEQQIQEASILLLPFDFEDTPLKALYSNGVIGLSPNIKNTAEKRCILAEEYCHHCYSVGNILCDCKQEAFARRKSYEMLVPLCLLREAEKDGCRTVYEFAEYLEVTEEVLILALAHYRAKGLI